MSIDEILSSPEVSRVHQVFAEAVSQAQSAEQMGRFLQTYVAFNHPFAGGVLNLAAGIHLNESWFQPGADGAATPGATASIVASHVAGAAEDEFATPGGKRITHRYIADRLLATFARRCGHQIDAIDDDLSATRQMRRLAEAGYGVGSTWSPDAVGRSLGFHLASEYSGGVEFRELDRCLAPMAAAHGISRQAYTWIALHVSVEPEHFALARRAIDLTLRYSPTINMSGVITGVHEFFDLLTFFADTVRAPSSIRAVESATGKQLRF